MATLSGRVLPRYTPTSKATWTAILEIGSSTDRSTFAMVIGGRSNFLQNSLTMSSKVMSISSMGDVFFAFRFMAM